MHKMHLHRNLHKHDHVVPSMYAYECLVFICIRVCMFACERALVLDCVRMYECASGVCCTLEKAWGDALFSVVFPKFVFPFPLLTPDKRGCDAMRPGQG